MRNMEEQLESVTQEEIEELTLDESWSHDLPLSEELQRLDEEQKKQIEEARAWLEEEEAADEIMRKELAELQLADKINHELSAKLIQPEPELPAEVTSRIQDLELKVKSLQDEVNDKTDKLRLRYDSYSEVVSKLNETTEKMIQNDSEFKKSIAKIKQEYGELENVLKAKINTYQELNKELELKLNGKEEEIQEIKDSTIELAELKKSFEDLVAKHDQLTKNSENLNKLNLKLKVKLKTVTAEKNQFQQDKENTEVLKSKIAELEKARDELLKEKESLGNVEFLKNRIILLEEEKGNLQLQLVDLDEIKESMELNKTSRLTLEKENDDYRNLIMGYEEELRHFEKSKTESLKSIEEQEEVIKLLKETLERVTSEKIDLAMKCAELEETVSARDRELGQKSDTDLLSDYNMSNGLAVKLSSVQEELEETRRELTQVQTQWEAAQSQISQLTEELKKTKGDEQAVKFKKLAANYKLKSKMCAELEDQVKRCEQDLKDLRCGAAQILYLMKEFGCDVSGLRDVVGVAFDALAELSDAELEPLKGLVQPSPEVQVLREMYERECRTRESLDGQFEELKSELMNAVQENESKNELVNSLVNELSEVKLKLTGSDLSEKYGELIQKNDEMHQKLMQAEEMSQTFNLYQKEVEARAQAASEREMTLTQQLNQVLYEGEALKKENSVLAEELKSAIASAETAMKELVVLRENESFFKNKICSLEVDMDDIIEEKKAMEAELESFRDMRDAYNTTLDKIEVLNAELKDTMEEFEAKNERVSKLEYERKKLINKLEELEAAFNDLERKLDESEMTVVGLTSRLELQQAVIEESSKRVESVSSSAQTPPPLPATSTSVQTLPISSTTSTSVQTLPTSVPSSVPATAPRDEPEMDNPFGDLKDEEDGWGWMGETPDGGPPILDPTLSRLEEEKRALTEELEASKSKCQKLMRKLKETKIHNEKLARTGFSDLDFALQEEMRSENDKLTRQLAELTIVLNQLKAEKENLLKRVDTLTSANEQLVDMKERQDIEVQMWQKRSNECSSQVARLEWALEEMQSGAEGDPELSLKLRALSEENEEIRKHLESGKEELGRALVREQDLEQELELKAATVSSLTKENDQMKVLLTEEKTLLESLRQENEKLRTDVQALAHKTEQSNLGSNQDLEAQIQIFTLENESLLKARTEFEAQIRTLTSDNESLLKAKTEFEAKYQTLTSENESLLKAKTEFEAQIRTLTSENESLLNSRTEFEAKYQTLTSENESLLKAKTEFEAQISSLRTQLADLANFESVLAQAQNENAGLMNQLSYYNSQYHGVVEERKSLIEELERLRLESTLAHQENEKLKIEIDQLKKLTVQENKEPKPESVNLFKGFASSEDPFEELVQARTLTQVESSPKLEDHLDQIRDLTEELNRVKSVLSDFEGEKVELNRLLDEVKDRLDRALKDNERLTSEMEGLNQYANMSRDSAQAEIKALECANNNLNSVIKERLEEIDVLKKTVAELEDRVADQNKELDELRRHVAELQTQASSEVVEEAIRLSSLVSEYEMKVKIQEEQLNEKNRELDVLQNRLNLQGTPVNNSDQTLAHLEQERIRLEKLVSEKMAEAANFEKEVNLLKGRVEVEKVSGLIDEKDAEINRLTKALIDTQEKLLLAQQGKMYPEAKALQLKLDQALYTLHARDVRCEELTHEIVQLLDERDSLQFRLSEALRAFDTLRKGESSDEPQPRFDPKAQTRSTMEYKKDPYVQNERETRHKEHLQLYSKSEPIEKEENSSVDYGFFNWFFGGSPSQPMESAE